MSLLKVEWKAESVRLNAESFINRLNFIDDFNSKYRPKYILADCKQMVYKQFSGKEYLLFERIQSKINKSILQKLAIIISKDKITHTLINQVFFNPELKKTRIKAFDNPILAQSWLLCDEKVRNLQTKYLISA